MEQAVLSTGVRTGEKMTLKRFERLLKDRYILTMVSAEGEIKLSMRWKFGEGNTLLKKDNT